jgi:hypothetical protein
LTALFPIAANIFGTVIQKSQLMYICSNIKHVSKSRGTLLLFSRQTSVPRSLYWDRKLIDKRSLT